ncbi:MAG: peptidoglycan DD-metalloendopeptidase family protein [Alphaproteobacteria bacterium]
MAQPARVRRSFLFWMLPLLTAGACTACPAGSAQRPAMPEPAFLSGDLLALSSDYYVVRASEGDTYMGLAWEHNVSPHEVISLNHVEAPYRLEPGELVRIPTPRIHVVRRGETLSGVAEAYHVDFYDLAQANGLNAPFTIFPGQVLRLPSSGPVFRSPRKPPVHASTPPAAPRPPPKPKPKPGPRPAPEQDDSVEVIVQAAAAEAARAAPPVRLAVRPRPKPPAAATEPEGAEPEPRPATAPATPVSSSAPAAAAGELVWPVRGRIISGFGPTPNGRHNDGINIAVPERTPVRAAADGEVIYIGNEVGGFGNLILIRHEGDLVTAYAHTSEFKVAKGEKVRKGQPIALSGSTGNVEMPQLHFEVRRGVTAVDPVEHLSA